MGPSFRAVSLAAAAAAVALPIVPAEAKKHAPKPPSTATVKKLLQDAYCAPSKNARGEVVQSVVVTFKTVKIAKARYGRYFYDGVPPNTKIYVFPVRADYFCDFTYTNDVSSLKASDKHFSGDYVVFRDEFGAWRQTNKNHKSETIPGNN